MNKNLLNNKAFVISAALLCCALWGISTPLVKIGYAYTAATHVPSLLLWAGVQFAVAGAVTLGIYSIYLKKLALPKKESFKGVAIISLLQTVLQYTLLYTGLLHTSSVKGSIIKSTDVFFVAIIASLLFKLEKLTAKKAIACLIGFIGIIVMNLKGLSFEFNLIGDGLVTLAILSYSFSVVMVKLFAKNEDPIILCGCQMTLGGIVMLIIGSVLGGSVNFLGMFPIFICLCFIYAVSYTLWTVLLKFNSPSGITIYSFTTPVFGVAFSAFLLSEDSGVEPANLAAALVMVCFGIILWGYEKNANESKNRPD